MILTQNDGKRNVPELVNEGWQKCYSPDCNFYIHPVALQRIKEEGRGYYTCPSCERSWSLIEDPFPYQGDDTSYEAYKGGITTNGLDVTTMGQLGEDLIESQGELPGYGPITWWHKGGASAKSHLDGATEEWGVEVKSISYDARNHRFIAGGVRKRADGSTYDERVMKMEAARSMGKKGLLGLLVLLDFRNSVADVYAREMPLERVRAFNWRSKDKEALHLLEVLPFKNPFLDPYDPNPVKPTPVEEAPF